MDFIDSQDVITGGRASSCDELSSSDEEDDNYEEVDLSLEEILWPPQLLHGPGTLQKKKKLDITTNEKSATRRGSGGILDRGKKGGGEERQPPVGRACNSSARSPTAASQSLHGGTSPRRRWRQMRSGLCWRRPRVSGSRALRIGGSWSWMRTATQQTSSSAEGAGTCCGSSRRTTMERPRPSWSASRLQGCSTIARQTSKAT